MKKFFKVLIKILVFFFLWAVLGGLITVPSENPAVWRFWAEFVPFALVAADSVLFRLIERKKLWIWGKTRQNPVSGIAVGAVWVLIPAAVLYFMGVITFDGPEFPSMLWLWLIAMFVNTVMQELLVRGYMYQLIRKEYNVVPAVIFTTALFTIFHGGALEAGILAVINVITMSLAMSFALEYTESLLTPVLLHGVYNLVDGILLGTGTVADYPHVFSAQYHGPAILTGGSFEMSGSIIVTIVNCVLAAAFFILWMTNNRPRRRQKGNVWL